MNRCIVDLLTNHESANKLVSGLPIAFEQASLEMPSNPAVGMIREQALIGFFYNTIGSGQIRTMKHGNQRGHDLMVCGKELSIKTVTKNGGIKILWTVDQGSIANESLIPDCDIFLVQIWWGENCRSIFYIPLEVQLEICNQMGANNYHKIGKTGTNNRGIELSKDALSYLLKHNNTISLQVNWTKQGLNYTPYKRWEDFWAVN